MKKDGHYKLLVVEDNPGDFALVEAFLNEQMMDPIIQHAHNFEEAATILDIGLIQFDAILLDLTLPDKCGNLLITAMLSFAASCPIIILTGNADIDFSISSIGQGISDYLLKDELNAPVLYKSIMYAIERKKTIEALRESEHRYSDLFHLSPGPVWVYELETLNFLDVNVAAVRLYGYSRNEFLRMTITDLVTEEVAQLEVGIRGINFHDPLYDGIFLYKKKDGTEIYVKIHSNTIVFMGKKGKLVVGSDITEGIQYIREIEKQNKKLQEIAWLQSHVIRAPLAKIMGIATLIKELNIETPECAELLDHLIDSGNEFDIVVKDIINKAALYKV